MHYAVSLSGGVASAVAGDLAIRRYGRDAITFWFSDVKWEDHDNYRFIQDCMQRWGGELVTYTDGRTPLQVAEDHHIIPNQRIAPCSLELKIKPFVKFLATQPKPLTVLLGLDWKETHRMARPKASYEAIEGVTVDYPLMWKPIEFRPYQEVVRSWGIEPPRMYAAGFSHANCGGRCVKQGVGDWNRLRFWEPERFAEVRDWEQEQRAKGGARATYAICRDSTGGDVKPLTLVEIEQRAQPSDDEPTQEDIFACLCSY
jgi:3'-phosphoadenosine 5'-phosphosulfate sulfotransferase (PAPS reductase)/FAD synthetase